jgi:hypothetical protein
MDRPGVGKTADRDADGQIYEVQKRCPCSSGLCLKERFVVCLAKTKVFASMPVSVSNNRLS